MLRPTKARLKWRDEIADASRGAVSFDEPLASHTTLGIGGAADLWFQPADVADLSTALAIVKRRRVPWKVLGKGSNSLVADSGFRGMIVNLPQNFCQMEVSVRGDLVRVMYSAGMSAMAAYRHACESELVGLEFLAGIPGSIGGALYMNAGTRLGDMSDVVDGFEFAKADGARFIQASEIGFSYRKASIPDDGVVTRIALLLRQADQLSLELASKQVGSEMEWRLSAQPKGRSAGSVFKNPPGDFAGRLIDECGLKGYRVGGACISDAHANFIINEKAASAADVCSLIEICRRKVEARFGVLLELEVELIGEQNAD